MNKEIPVFFTIDNSYAPFLAVALNSMIKNANPRRQYKAIVLHQGLNENNLKKLKAFDIIGFCSCMRCCVPFGNFSGVVAG